MVAGHSLGEYAALVASGVLTLTGGAPGPLSGCGDAGSRSGRCRREAAILGLDAAGVIAGCAEAQASFGAGSAEVVGPPISTTVRRP